MPADPPFIVPSTHPFKVEATPSKMGGVDALAKRPLDMSGQSEPLPTHRESMPVEALPDDSWATLPPDPAGGSGVEGPVLQELIDTSHREFFDDPSRYLRTDAVVKLPDGSSTRATRSDATLARDATSVSQVTSPSQVSTAASRASNDRRSVRQARAAQQALSTASAEPPRLRGSPEQRRDAFNQRLASILTHQQHVKDELSAVEQAVQNARARVEKEAGDKPSSVT